MNINEFEKAVGLPRTVIYYYVNHLPPDVSDSSKCSRWRSYSENDVSRIKTTILLRKLGITIEEIETLLTAQITLTDLLQKRVVYYDNELAPPAGAKRFCVLLLNTGETIDTLDIEAYTAAVQEAETAGEAFEDTRQDRMGSSSLTRTYWNLLLSQRFGKSEKRDLALAGLEALLIAVGCGLADRLLVQGGSFWGTFLQVLGVFCFFTLIIALPVNLLGRKHPTAAWMALKGLFIAGCLLLGLLMLFIAVLLLNYAFHFWY